MPARRPLVLVNGRPTVLPAGDTVEGAEGSTSTQHLDAGKGAVRLGAPFASGDGGKGATRA